MAEVSLRIYSAKEMRRIKYNNKSRYCRYQSILPVAAIDVVGAAGAVVVGVFGIEIAVITGT